MRDGLPALLRFADFGGDWPRYEDALYEAFCLDFVRDCPVFRNQAVHLKRHPLLDGKEATFWHFITEGPSERARTPDLRRCERIRWPRAIIERHDDPSLKVWENERGRDRRVCLWLESEEYLVVLADRGTFVLPWTAYLVTESHRKRKLQKEYEDYQRHGVPR
jgi:hypothetical protein